MAVNTAVRKSLRCGDLASVKIAPKRATRIPRIHELNQRLETRAASRKRVRFLDCGGYPEDAPVLRGEWAKVKTPASSRQAAANSKAASSGWRFQSAMTRWGGILPRQ